MMNEIKREEEEFQKKKLSDYAKEMS